MQVDVRYNAWTVLDGADVDDSSDGVPILRSAAAGDMNPASERNNHCESCGDDGGKMSSWAYVTDGNGNNNETFKEMKKIKVLCK